MQARDSLWVKIFFGGLLYQRKCGGVLRKGIRLRTTSRVCSGSWQPRRACSRRIKTSFATSQTATTSKRTSSTSPRAGWSRGSCLLAHSSFPLLAQIPYSVALCPQRPPIANCTYPSKQVLQSDMQRGEEGLFRWTCDTFSKLYKYFRGARIGCSPNSVAWCRGHHRPFLRRRSAGSVSFAIAYLRQNFLHLWVVP